MSDEHSKIWRLGPPVSVALLIAALYVKIPEMREWVDARCPLIPAKLAEHGYRFSPSSRPKPAPRKEVATTKAIEAATPPVAQSTPWVDSPVDLVKLSATREEWPKAVALKKTTTFPAVVNGKVVGNLSAQSGTEARLVTIQNGKLGLEYRGGGAWLAPEDTDLVSRVQLARRTRDGAPVMR